MNAINVFDNHRLSQFIAIVLIGCFVGPSSAAGQDILISGVAITENDTAAQVEAAIAVVEARQGLNEETKAKVLEQLREAETLLQNKLNADAAAELFASALNSAPAETDALRATLDEQLPEPETIESLGIDDSISLTELQQMLARATADLTAVESALAEFKAQVETQVGRPAAARERIAQLQKEREELAATVDYPEVVGEEQILTNARKVSAQLRRAAQGAEINKLEQEMLSHAVRLDL